MNTNNGGRRGFTLTELLVTMAIFALVMTLLAFPLLSAFGYIQKAIARYEAQQAALRTMNELARELNTAMYVFPVPSDGSWLAFLKESTDASARSLGMPMNYDPNSSAFNATLVRYARVLDFPWNSSGTGWALSSPDYRRMSDDDSRIYSTYYMPFFTPQVRGEYNPYILTRFQQSLPWTNVWGSASSYSLNSNYPLETYTETNRDMLWRTMHNDLVPVTPVGQEWDVTNFRVTPQRMASESLNILSPAYEQATATVAVSRYPLWIGRNRDIDNLLDTNQLAGSSAYAFYTLDDIANLMRDWAYLYPVKGYNADWVATANAPFAPVNPYGYQVRIYSSDGQRQYGLFYDATAANYTIYCHRHFMDWPVIDRPDWDSTNPLWTGATIARQRMEGKLVFAQPYMPDASIFNAYVANSAANITLPIPNSWDSSITRLVSLPTTMAFDDGSGNEVRFRLVTRPTKQLENGTYQFDAGKHQYWIENYKTRTIAFSDSTVGYTLANPRAAAYSICDLQPGDVIEASYSTGASMKVALTLSRQDRTTKGKYSQQTYTVNRIIEARNAIKKARSEE